MPKQKGFAHIFVVLLLLIGVGAGIYLVQHPAIFKPRADEDSTLCKAFDAASFRTCLYSAQTNPNISKIEITKQIVCTSKAECVSVGSGGGFLLSERTRPLTIFGTPGTAAGFKRVQNYDYALLSIGGGANEVQNITLKDLVFDETTAECDFTIEGTGKCNSPLLLGSKIGDSTVDHITVLHAKNHGMQVATARNLVIKNSIFYDAQGDGIWFNSAYASTCPAVVEFTNFTPCDVDMSKVNNTITIQNNLFADNNVSGVEFYSYTANPDYPNKIIDNLFVHNHRNAKYIQCPNPLPKPQPTDESLIQRRGGHCPGGQLAIARSKSVLVEKNIFRDAIIDAIKPNDRYEPQPGAEGAGKTYDALGLKNPGIELSETLDDIKIQNNKIFNNRLALFADYIGPRFRTNNVNIIWNIAYAHELGNFIANGDSDPALIEGFGNDGFNKGGYHFANNITDPNYNLPLPKAFIFADPPICEPTQNGKCASAIRWFTNDHSGVKVSVKGSADSILAATPDAPRECAGCLLSGQKVDWISAAGATFQLLDASKTVLGETTVKYPKGEHDDGDGGDPGTPPPPGPSVNPVVPDRATGTITAAPCSVPSGQTRCTSKITWSTTNAVGPVKITIKETGGLFAQGGNSGSQDFPWVSSAPLTMQLVDGNNPTPLATVVVKALSVTGQISATPCTLAAGKTTCNSTITWSTSNATGPVKVTIKETGGLFASGNSGSQVAPWISTTPLTMQLMDGNNPTPLATVVAKATAAPSIITASPNPCKLNAGRCTSRITWNAPGVANFDIYLKENNLVFDRRNAGFLDITFVTANGATFQARSNGQVLDTIVLKGTP